MNEARTVYQSKRQRGVILGCNVGSCPLWRMHGRRATRVGLGCCVPFVQFTREDILPRELLIFLID